MGEMSGVTHELKSYIMSCSEEISRVESDIYQTQKALDEHEQAYPGLAKVIHRGKYSKRKEFLQNKLSELKTRQADLELEMKIYKNYGLNPPADLPNREKVMSIIQARDTKMDIVFMVEMGQM